MRPLHTYSPPSYSPWGLSPAPSTQAQPLFVQRNASKDSTQGIELDELPRASRSPAPSILETIRSFSILRSKSSLAKQDDTTPHRGTSIESTDDEISYAWVKPVVICALGSSIIAAINIILTIAALGQSRSKYSDSPVTAGSLYEGSCSTSKGWATGLHLVINILSTLLLGASNYCMQCLSAPSRADVDRAHAKRTWLDIGTSSLRNLRFINTRRKILWLILLTTSTPIHLIYNSVVYSTLTTYEYPVLVAPASWDFKATPIHALGLPEEDDCFEEFTAREASGLGKLLADGSFERITKQQCVEYYATDYISDRKTVIALVNNLTEFSTAILPGGIGNGVDLSTRNPRYSWMCDGIHDYDEDRESCDKDRILRSLDKWSILVGNWLSGSPHIVFGAEADGGDSTVLFDRWNYSRVIGPSTSDDIKNDMDTLISYLDNIPPEPKLIQFLNNATNWENGSWASSLDYYDMPNYCDEVSVVTQHKNNTDNYAVESCLSEQVEEECKLVYNLPICLIVIACSIIKVICMFLTAKENRTDILLTIGDAVASFLTTPDLTTANRCLMTKGTVEKGVNPWRAPHRSKRTASGRASTWWKGYSTLPWVNTSQELDAVPLSVPSAPGEVVPGILPGRKRWFQAVGWVRWAVVTFLATASLGTAGGLLRMGILTLRQDRVDSIQGLWDIGFGKANPATMISFERPSTIEMIFLANSPQLLLSMIYFAYNNLLTAMTLSAEYANHSTHRKPLRVSWPKGLQQSSYYLTLPYQYSVPLLSFSAALHWLLSQSIFYTRIDLKYVKPNTFDRSTSQFITACGYSPMALIFTILVGSIMTAGLVLLGLRRYPGIPLAGNCSAAISAACHPPPDDERPALKAIKWGEVAMETKESPSPMGSSYTGSGGYFAVDEGKGLWDASTADDQGQSTPRSNANDATRARYAHCCFTSKEVVTPLPTKLYV